MTHTRRKMLTVARKTLSALLVLLMLLSVFPAFSITASAADRYIYYENTNNYGIVYAYAWDKSNNNAEKLGAWPGTAMERLGTSNYYRISVDTSANMIIFNGGSDSNKTGDLNIPTYNNPLYSNSLWSSNFDETPYVNSGGGGGGGEITVGEPDAVTTHSFGNGIYAANATYFDYMSDEEITGSYLDPIKAGTGHNYSADNWYPFYRFNRAIKVAADRNANWQYPLYLGNFCNVSGAYDTSAHGGNFLNATNSDNVTRFDYTANNSNRENVNAYGYDKNVGITSYDEAVQGLVYNRLNSGKTLMATSTLKSPYFDTEFLTKKYAENGYESSNGRRIAKVFKSYFPFRESTSNGYSTYSFDSYNATDNVYFTWNGETPTVANYGSGRQYGVVDGLSHFMKDEASGYGIFPFNNASGNNKGNRYGNDNLDYGYGIRIDIDFRVTGTGTVDGTQNGTPITFNFSGDDDIWVFISNDQGGSDLVLDLGGNHKMASGKIDFKTMKATANKVFDRSTNRSKGAQTISFNNGNKLNPNKIYHMTVFYMERGLIESNFQMNFSFYPLDNILTTEKYVETANVNSGIKQVVAEVDDFTITNKANGSPATQKEYTLDGVKNKTNNSGSYTIKNGQKASFNNIAKTGSTLNVTESMPTDTIYKYSTKYTVTDVENNEPVKTGYSTSTGDFTFQNTKSPNDLTNFNVAFYNTPAISSISLEKRAVNSSGKVISSDMDFPFTILLDIDGNGANYGYSPYPLEYTVSGDTSTYTTDRNGKFSIKAGKTIMFKGIPVNAKYKIVETANDEIYKSNQTNNTVEGTVSSIASSNRITFKNTMITADPTSVKLQAEKLLDGQSNFKEKFSFTLQEVDSSGKKIGELQTKQNVNMTSTNGKNVIEFDSINITPVDTNTTGTYTYKRYFEISEVNGSCDAESEDVSFVYDNTKHYATITITQSTSKIDAKVTYYSSLASAVAGNSMFAEDTVVFRNYHKGKMTISKVDNNGNPIKDNVQFSLYKVDKNGADISKLTPIKTQEVKDGVAVFDNLDIYKFQSSNNTSKLQWYCVVESKQKDGYAINATQHYFVIPEAKVSETSKYDFEDNGKKYSYVLKNGEKIYNIKYQVTNAPLTVPSTSGSGTAKYIYGGLTFIALGFVMTGTYIVTNRRKRRKCEVK